jgi:hypothetical protein
MSNVIPQYSSLFHCLYDEQCDGPNLAFHYSVFRALDCRDVDQNSTALPYVHDFAVIWDDDHDTRIIHLLEEMLMAGILPGVQFIGEHKGELNVILAARTYWKIDAKAFADRLHTLSGLSAGDYWNAEIGMYDRSPHSLRTGHQCDFKNLLGLSAEEEHAYLFSIDSRWKLGTKRWKAADAPENPTPAGPSFSAHDHYEIRGYRPNSSPPWATTASQ